MTAAASLAVGQRLLEVPREDHRQVILSMKSPNHPNQGKAATSHQIEYPALREIMGEKHQHLSNSGSAGSG